MKNTYINSLLIAGFSLLASTHLLSTKVLAGQDDSRKALTEEVKQGAEFDALNDYALANPSLLQLPPELWLEVTHFLGSNDFKSFAQACRFFNQLLLMHSDEIGVHRSSNIYLKVTDKFIQEFMAKEALGLGFQNRYQGLKSIKLPKSTKDEALNAFAPYIKDVMQLNLAECSLIGEGLESLKELSNLRSLNLTKCQKLTDALFGYLKELPNLRSLNLTKCRKIENESLKKLAEALPNLRYLDLSKCFRIRGVGLKNLETLKKLNTIHLSKCDIRDKDLLILGVFTELEHLSLRSCSGVTDAGIPHLTGLSALQSLSLVKLDEDHELTYDAFKCLNVLMNLKYLELIHFKKYSGGDADNELKALQSQLPRCTIVEKMPPKTSHNWALGS